MIGSTTSRKRAFYSVIAAQFFSSLADNALLIAAIGLLAERHAAGWMTPALRLFFYLSYVVLAAFAGTVADAWAKGRVMFATNLVKLGGCGLLVAQVHPLLAYALVGVGAAAYSPAKYGILTELLPAEELVHANAWIEVSTVLSILLGVGLGSVLMDAAFASYLVLSTPAANASLMLTGVYGLGAVFAAMIPATAAPSLSAWSPAVLTPRASLREFRAAFLLLWRDPEGQISLAVTSLFWAVSATLQFLILRWAAVVLHLPLSQAALLQCAVAIGMIAGAIAAARFVPLKRALKVLPLGVAIGAIVLLMTIVNTVWVATGLLLATGALSGFFLVPMNALLQHRGKILMHSGLSVAVQNFNENLASLVLLAVYGGLIYLDAPLLPTIVGFGVLVGLTMLLILLQQRANSRARKAEAWLR